MIREGMRDRARELRAGATTFEQAFWACVRAKRLSGFKFRRQQVIGGYVVDFVCMEARLVVELDGEWHFEDEQRGYDEARDAWLTAEGFRVMRVRNREWMGDQVGVLDAVLDALKKPSPQTACEDKKPSPQPLPPDGGGAKEYGAVVDSESASLAPLPHLGGGAGGEGVLRKENPA
jgi:very-short-patch-repair endonuclease